MKLIFNPFLWNIDNIALSGTEYLHRPSASGNIPTLGAIFIDIPQGRVEYL